MSKLPTVISLVTMKMLEMTHTYRVFFLWATGASSQSCLDRFVYHYWHSSSCPAISRQLIETTPHRKILSSYICKYPIQSHRGLVWGWSYSFWTESQSDPGKTASGGEGLILAHLSCALRFFKFFKFWAVAAWKAHPVLFYRLLQTLLVVGAVKVSMGSYVTVPKLFL